MTARAKVVRSCGAFSSSIVVALCACSTSTQSGPNRSDGAAAACDASDAVHAASIESFVSGLQHGSGYAPLSLAQTNAVRAAARALLGGDISTARDQATVAAYRVVPLAAGSQCHWAMQPTDAAPAGQATLVVATDWDRDLVIEAPHIPNDRNTDAEAAIVFDKVRARALVLAGAQRCAVTTPSGCHANPECGANDVAVDSDPSHSVTNALHAMHLGLTTGGSQSVTLQLHTNVFPSLNGTAMVSNGTLFPIAGTFADALYAALRAPDVDVRSCNDAAHPPPAGAFCGETNAQSLGSNGAADCCTAFPSRAGDAAAHRFIQLEQSSAVLGDVSAWATRVATAVGNAVPVKR